MPCGYFIQNYYTLKWIQESSISRSWAECFGVYFFASSAIPNHHYIFPSSLTVPNLWEVLQVLPHLMQHLLVPYWQSPKHKCICFPISVSPAARHEIDWRIDMIKEIAFLKGKHPSLKTMGRDCRWVGAISQFI